jgi:hypothetical protein
MAFERDGRVEEWVYGLCAEMTPASSRFIYQSLQALLKLTFKMYHHSNAVRLQLHRKHFRTNALPVPPTSNILRHKLTSSHPTDRPMHLPCRSELDFCFRKVRYEAFPKRQRLRLPEFPDLKPHAGASGNLKNRAERER